MIGVTGYDLSTRNGEASGKNSSLRGVARTEISTGWPQQKNQAML